MTQAAGSQCAMFRVEGRVQGVFFRASTQQEARRLEITGWVRNTEDGAVELVACGPALKLMELETWLQHGPVHARVARVTRKASAAIAAADFVIRYE